MTLTSRFKRWLSFSEQGRPQVLDQLPESTRAKQRAIDDLWIAKSRRAEVRQVVTSLAELRARNHFADQIRLIFAEESR